MSRSRLATPAAATLALALMGLVLDGQAPVQQNSPHAAYVYPAGGRQGTTVHVTVGGRYLNGVSDTRLSGGGAEARIVAYDRPLNASQRTALREQIQELLRDRTAPAARRQIADLRARIADSVRRAAQPTLAERVTIEVRIARDAEPGPRELRLRTPAGLSGPLVFHVGQLPEVTEEEVGDGAGSPALLALPVTINGRVLPAEGAGSDPARRRGSASRAGDVDRYRFRARRGQNLVAVVSARALTPYLADAVPGWFQATLALLDASGHELAYCDDFRFQPDPVLHAEIPEDGEYVIEIRDALYRGREDFVYRIGLGELPFVTSIFPLGGPAGDPTTVAVEGWNLDASRLRVPPRDEAGVYRLFGSSGDLRSNRVPFEVSRLPERLEVEPNDTVDRAEPVTRPLVVNGRIQSPGDRDLFRFAGRAGDEVAIEVMARRLDSPLDAVLELLDPSGERLAWSDDVEDPAFGLVTHQADARMLATLPENGTYVIRVGDLLGTGGAEYGYRLRVSAPEPDFSLWITPSSVNAPAGATVPISVHAVRRDGFTGDITVSLRRPAGYALSGGVLPAGRDRVRMTITMPAGRRGETVPLELEGRATTASGHVIVRRALPADDRVQAFGPHHLVPAGEVVAAVSGRGGVRTSARVLTPQPVRIPAGGSARVRVALPPVYLAAKDVRLELSDPPDGLVLRSVALGSSGAELVLAADSALATGGLRTNLIVTVSGEGHRPAATPAAAQGRRVPLGVLPAIAVEVIGPD